MWLEILWALLALAAVVHQGCRGAGGWRWDSPSLTLLLLHLVAVPLALVFDKSVLVGVIALLDALVVLTMLWVVTQCFNRGDCGWCEKSRRAQAVGLIGVGKIALGLAYASSGGEAVPWNSYALLINAAFVLQVAVSGGWLDGVGIFIDRLWRRLGGQPLGTVDHREGA